MPTVLLINGFRFFFYSNENNEPAHIHVTKANADGKIWLEPVLNIVTSMVLPMQNKRILWKLLHQIMHS
jgi:hypothetical protein